MSGRVQPMATLDYHVEGVGASVSISYADFAASSGFPKLNYKVLMEQLNAKTLVTSTANAAPSTEQEGPAQEVPRLPLRKASGCYRSIIDRLEKKYCGRDFIDMEVESEASDASEEPSDEPEAKRRKKTPGDYYDLEDDFIDDSETCQQIETHLKMKRTQTARTGFFASSGDLEIVKGSERLTVEKRKRDSSTKKRIVLPPPESLASEDKTTSSTGSGEVPHVPVENSGEPQVVAQVKPKKTGVWKPNDAMNEMLNSFLSLAKTYVTTNPKTKSLSSELEAALVHCYDAMEVYHRQRLFNKLGLCEAVMKELDGLSITYLKTLFSRVRAKENSTLVTNNNSLGDANPRVPPPAEAVSEPVSTTSTLVISSGEAQGGELVPPPSTEKPKYTYCGVWNPNDDMTNAINNFSDVANAYFEAFPQEKYLTPELEVALVDTYTTFDKYRAEQLFNKLGFYETILKKVPRLNIAYLRRTFVKQQGKDKTMVLDEENPADLSEAAATNSSAPCEQPQTQPLQNAARTGTWKPNDDMTRIFNDFLLPAKEYFAEHPDAKSLSPHLEASLATCFELLQPYRRLVNKHGLCHAIVKELDRPGLSVNYLKAAIAIVQQDATVKNLQTKFVDLMEQVCAKLKSRVGIVAPRVKSTSSNGATISNGATDGNGVTIGNGASDSNGLASNSDVKLNDEHEGISGEEIPKNSDIDVAAEGVLTCRWDVPSRSLLHQLETAHDTYISAENHLRKLKRTKNYLNATTVFENEVLPRIADASFPSGCAKGDVDGLKKALQTEKQRLKRNEAKKMAKLQESQEQLQQPKGDASDAAITNDVATTQPSTDLPENVDDAVLFEFDHL